MYIKLFIILELSVEEFTSLVNEVDRRLTNLPATAQVAKQQGNYLANVLNKDLHTTSNFENVKEFKYNHLGSFAYIGGNDVAMDLKQGAFTGFTTWLMWRSAYLSKQYSLENMVMFQKKKKKTKNL